jgi:hypothetical protein
MPGFGEYQPPTTYEMDEAKRIAAEKAKGVKHWPTVKTRKNRKSRRAERKSRRANRKSRRTNRK